MILVITHTIAICKVDICPMAISYYGFACFGDFYTTTIHSQYMYENDSLNSHVSLISLCSKLVILHWGRRFKAEVV
jgi:hypothetical protein